MFDSDRKPQHSERLIISGVDGVIGANLAMALAEHFTVLGLYRGQAVSFDGCQTARWAPEDRQAVGALVREVRPHWILHCGPFAQGSWDVPERVPAWEPEVRLCRLLAKLAMEAECRLTVLSTDAVFAGPRMFHRETSPPTRSYLFAQGALRVEQSLRKTAALVVRTHAYGWSPAEGEPGFAEEVWLALAEGFSSARPLAADRHASPILATDLAARLHRAYVRGLQGLYHISGAERTSQYRFAAELATAFGLQGPPVAAEPSPARGGRFLRLDETSLGTQRARRELGIAMPLLRNGLHRFAAQAKNGFRARLRARPQPLAA